VDTLVDAVKAKTDNLPGSPAAVGSAMTLADGAITADAIAEAAITAAKLATGAIAAVKIAADACNKLADHIRRRKQSNVEASSDGDALDLGSLYGVIQQIQESNTVDHDGKLTVYKTDGSTELGQKTITSDADADPMTGIS